MGIERLNQRLFTQIRTTEFKLNVNKYADGSCIICMGDTQIVCTATLTNNVPMHAKAKNTGWLTAEYNMLPSATHIRQDRDIKHGKQNARAQEIQRLIGRSLRACVNLSALNGLNIVLDCDVLQADAGTRTASINGAYVALALALQKHFQKSQTQLFELGYLRYQIAAISLGLIQETILLDLDYAEDSKCDVDLNLVMNQAQQIIEIQAASEQNPYTSQQLNQMLDLGWQGIKSILHLQNQALKSHSNL